MTFKPVSALSKPTGTGAPYGNTGDPDRDWGIDGKGIPPATVLPIALQPVQVSTGRGVWTWFVTHPLTASTESQGWSYPWYNLGIWITAILALVVIARRR
jgi:hypothetical protein